MHIETLASNTIKGLAMDAVQAASSGHPGMPMGMSDIATVLWGRFLKYDPRDPAWPDRDRVILSNGHGSMLLYSMLYLTGTALTLDDLKRFRQWGSPTAGHPEYGHAPGIETTTGPLGQGIANGVGMAIAEAFLASRFGREIVDHYTYVFCGDGCLMEGVSAEAASLAGHLGLGRLILLYDDNQITIDGATTLAYTEDVGARFRAYGWHVQHVDGHDREAVAGAIEEARRVEDRPSIICCRTVIAKGAPNLAGSAKSHGAPLGEAEIRAAKQALGMDPDQRFAVPDAVIEHFRARDGARAALRDSWRERLASHPGRETWARWHGPPAVAEVNWPRFKAGEKLASRKASHMALNAAAAVIDNLLGGSADLAESNLTHMKGAGELNAGTFGGRNLSFGVREHAMAAISNGLALHGGLRPYCATFLVFHDYMRPAVRLSALMGQPVVYVYTHDSVWLGEDGPTHQPVEHLMAMRAIPNLWVVRPSDANETVEAWRLALERLDGPTALCLTRQNLVTLDRERFGSAEGLHRGAYVLAEAEGDARVLLLATGSEVELALEARERLQAEGVPTRVVALPCWEAFELQEADYRSSVLLPGVPRVSIEAGVTMGWERWTGDVFASIGIDRFGASAPGNVVADKFGLNVTRVVQAVHDLLD